ncbi:MAG TPA: hypothetical protein VF773_03015 [Verrucomicrobiae bacterium]
MSLVAAQAAENTRRLPFSFNWETGAVHQVSVCVDGIPELPAKVRDLDILDVRVEPKDIRSAIGLPQISGDLHVSNNCVTFKPQFPFQPGVKYRATFRHPTGRLYSAWLEIPALSPEPTTVVTQIYPTAEVLPENLLKFYIYFSAPMSGGHIYEHIQLTDELDEPVELPFLEIDEELWNSDMTRLTLFLDPGRIKRGVKPLEEVGPALEENKKYTLTIANTWRDANGTPMKKTFQKKFRVAAADREAPELGKWKIVAPKVGSKEPLKVEFTDPMDHALALRMINVERVSGEKKLSENEKVWSFAPTDTWQPGSYRLQAQTTIEDLAGNNIGKPFEVDLFEGVQKRITNEVVSREFRVE